MQPQDAGFDWGHALSALGGGLVTAAGAAIGWIYKAGAREPTLKADLQKSLADAEQRVEEKIAESQRESETKLESLVTQFHEAFSGMRQKINDVELNAQKSFVAKGDFDDFRKEYREDMRDLKNLLSRKSH